MPELTVVKEGKMRLAALERDLESCSPKSISGIYSLASTITSFNVNNRMQLPSTSSRVYQDAKIAHWSLQEQEVSVKGICKNISSVWK